MVSRCGLFAPNYKAVVVLSPPMKISEAIPGTVVVYGRIADLKLGRGGMRVPLLAVGSYTEAISGCNRIVRPYSGRDRRAVIAVPEKQWDEDDGYFETWQPRCVSFRLLMAEAEYRVKEAGQEALALEIRSHEERRAILRREAEIALRAALPGIGEAEIHWNHYWSEPGDSRETYHNDPRPRIEFSWSAIRDVFGSNPDLSRCLAELTAFEATPDPARCAPRRRR